MSSQVVRVDALRVVAAGSISGTYVTLGSAFSHPMRLVKITNNTNGDLTFSFDAITDNMFIPAGGFTLYDCTTNRNESNVTFVFASGTQFFVKGTFVGSPTGSVYLEAIFGRGE